MPVPVDGVPVFRDFAGHGLVAGVPEADRGQGRADSAGEGQVAGPDREPGAASLPGGRGAAGGVEDDIPGQAGASSPGGEFLPDQGRGAGAEHRPRPGPAPRSGALASRSAVSDPSHRRL